MKMIVGEMKHFQMNKREWTSLARWDRFFLSTHVYPLKFLSKVDFKMGVASITVTDKKVIKDSPLNGTPKQLFFPYSLVSISQHLI